MEVHKHGNWYQLPEVYVRLQKDNLGYPPKDWEQLRAEPTDKEEVYKLKSIPFFARGLAYEDEVSVETSKEGYYPVVVSVVKRSGYSTMRLCINEKENKGGISDYFAEHNCLLEFNGNFAAVAIPENAFDEMSEYICDEKDRGRWDAEDGYLVIDADTQYQPGHI